jgi:hypothetical protein
MTELEGIERAETKTYLVDLRVNSDHQFKDNEKYGQWLTGFAEHRNLH